MSTATAAGHAVPSLRVPRARRAQRAEVAVGAVLGVMLIGLSVLISRFHLQPVEGVTVFAQLADASLATTGPSASSSSRR